MLKDKFLLDPEVIFLNHGSFGACPRPVFEVYQMWQRQLEKEPVQFLGVQLDEYLYKARQELGEYLNTSVNNLVFIPNATHGVNIIARSINLKPGDEILTTNHEYGACIYIWEFICEKTGATLKKQSIPTPINSNEEILEQLWQGVTSNTRIIFISHITSPTSIIMPVELICQRAREEGILTLIDGAHAPGQVYVDLSSINADFYVGNCHKWMLSPKGAGFLYAHPDAQIIIEPLIVSWGFQSKFNNPRESYFIDVLQWTGTKDPAAALSVPAAIEFMDKYDWDNVRAASHKLLQEAMVQICEISNTSPIYPIDSKFYQQMGTIPIPKMRDLNDLKTRLYHQYKIEIPVIDWNEQHFLRLSVQGYNTAEDIGQLINALKTEIALVSI